MGVFTSTAFALGAGLESWKGGPMSGSDYFVEFRSSYIYTTSIKSIWTPALSEKLSTNQERGNTECVHRVYSTYLLSAG